MADSDFKAGRDGVSRRAFMGYSVAATAVPILAARADGAAQQGGGGPSPWPEFLLKREADELLLRVRAVGFRYRPGSRKLVPSLLAAEQLLVFTLPPQHFSESTIGITDIPASVSEAELARITLVPSAETILVFRLPKHPIRLTAAALLDWDRFEAVLGDPQGAGQDYDLAIPRGDEPRISRIEMPWGIELAPVDRNEPLIFSGAPTPRVAQGWTELWSTALVAKRPGARLAPLKMEVFSIRGFKKMGMTGSVAQYDLVVTYASDRVGPQQPVSPPIEDKERAELAASLSRRFPYTGQAEPYRESAQIRLPDQNISYSAAYVPGRWIAVDQFRLSGRGGTLELLAKFTPVPGSALSSWSHSLTMGRDTFVQIVREGFLYPFGTPCQLIILSQRIFTLDGYGHFVAPLAKQAFLRVHQPNHLGVGHAETPFETLSVTTEQSPPLDLPPSGNPSDYGSYEYFVPTVRGEAFRFEHLGTDWGGEQHRSSMPMIFVSNRAVGAKGLVWEPGYAWAPTNPAAGDPAHRIPRDGLGLRVVDRLWATLPGRFASYGGAVVSLAPSQITGRTALKLDWVEWTRGGVPDLSPVMPVKRPFRPRARTLRVQDLASSQLSGEASAMLATYRDIRFVGWPFLDPEPTTPPADYVGNMTARSEDPDTPFLYFLESRALVAEAGRPAERPVPQIAADLVRLYYRTAAAGSVPVPLLEEISNEIRFGAQSSADGVGGLSVPDTHANIVNRRFGVVGDATFNERRWGGLARVRAKLEAARRLDFAAYALARPPLDQGPPDLGPFDATRTAGARAQAVAAARALMGYGSALALVEDKAVGTAFSAGLSLGDLFGADAELIPGMRFADLFRDIALAGSGGGGAPALASGGRPQAAEPLAWTVKLAGLQWLTDLQRSGALATALPAILAQLLAKAEPVESGEPISLGMEAALSWTNSLFARVDIGPAAFVPGDDTRIVIDAAARIDLGVPTIEAKPPRLSFSPGKPRIRAKTEVTQFAVEIFKAIRLNFESVSFAIQPDGSKSFSTRLASVDLLPPLDFINQLQSILGGLGGDSGMRLEISPQRAKISQMLAFPVGGGPLFIGPAQVLNLALHWSVTIPLMGREVLSVAFGISSREKPLTIFVPPWYGGKAYVLIEATTRGCRLVEISMEYGALIPIEWGPARGQASLTAGLFYQLRRDDATDSARVEFTGFVKAAAHLSVAGIIRFNGLIYIALRYIEDSGGRLLIGTSKISVSVKIAFVRYSYSFTAEHIEERRGDTQALVGTPALIATAKKAKRGRGTLPPEIGVRPYGRGASSEARAALDRLMAGYRGLERSA